MLGIGSLELLIIVAVVVLVWLTIKLFKNVSRFEAWLTKRSEARFLDSPGETGATHDGPSKLWWLPFPYAVMAVVISYIIAIVVILAIYGDSPEGLSSNAVDVVDNLIYLAACGLAFAGVWMHFTPGSNRKTKYELLVSATSVLSTGFLFLFALLFSASVYDPPGFLTAPRPALDPEVAVGAVIFHILFLIALQAGFSLWLGPPSRDDQPSQVSLSNRRLYYKVRKSGYFFAILSFSGLTQPFLTVYLILRYILGKKMASAPILYLRSFNYVEGPLAFGKIVARIASRYGVLRALVHRTQRPLQLHAETRLTERAEVAAAPDESWQSWIEDQMQNATAVIIDYTVDTQGLTWELDRAAALVDHSKIIVLVQKGVEVETPPDIWRMEYEIGKAGEKAARAKLDAHMRSLLLPG